MSFIDLLLTNDNNNLYQSNNIITDGFKMQSRNQIINDLSKLVTNAFGLAQNATGEIENAVKSLLDRYLADKGLITREEYELLKEIQDGLSKELLILKKEINSLKAKSSSTKIRSSNKISKKSST